MATRGCLGLKRTYGSAMWCSVEATGRLNHIQRKYFHDFNLSYSSSSFRRLVLLRVLLLSFVLEILGGFGTIAVVTTSSGEVFLNAVWFNKASCEEEFSLQVILLLPIFAGGSFIISELVWGLRFIACSTATTLWKDPEFVFDFPSILGRNEALFVDLNSSLESFRGAFLSTAGRLLANAASVFEAL